MSDTPIAAPTPTETAARVHQSASSHWYRQDGTACHEVQKADGKGMRKSTLADARKLNLLPSVTTILKLLDKPGLNDWRIEQAALAVLTAPRSEGEALDHFVTRVLHEEKQQDEEAARARELGTRIHDAIALYYEGQPVPADMQPYIAPAITAINAYGDRASSEVVLVGDDYAGTTDLLQDCAACWRIWDWKSSKKLPDPKKGAWTEHLLQLSAYARAFQNKLIRAGSGLKPIIVANVYISSVNPGEFVVCEHKDWETTYEDGFAPIVKHWQWMTGYRPENPDREEELDASTLIQELQDDLAVARAETEALRKTLAAVPTVTVSAPVVAATSPTPAPVGQAIAGKPLPPVSKDGRKVQWSTASAPVRKA